MWQRINSWAWVNKNNWLIYIQPKLVCSSGFTSKIMAEETEQSGDSQHTNQAMAWAMEVCWELRKNYIKVGLPKLFLVYLKYLKYLFEIFALI